MKLFLGCYGRAMDGGYKQRPRMSHLIPSGLGLVVGFVFMRGINYEDNKLINYEQKQMAVVQSKTN